MPRFAVVKTSSTGQHNFTQWHQSLEEAKEEASRLATKEQKEFFIMKEVGKVKILSCPILYEEIQ